jgi:preprotein translocase subunit YajC
MEMLILFGIVGVPLISFCFFAMYKAQQEERKEQQADLQVQNP